ncbi:MAG: type II toxin-antitoxin system Phd/YefM family antitoxin [Alphaproteobacteria bacterium]|nr:type II toxin-antitoxin system Phd/YefM family antitoxin [Alphaproteobacteria bacterium]
MRRWAVQDAKARFSGLLAVTAKEGPQIVTKRGIDTAVLVPVKEWERLQSVGGRSFKGMRLANAPRFDIALPRRGQLRRRAPKPLR